MLLEWVVGQFVFACKRASFTASTNERPDAEDQSASGPAALSAGYDSELLVDKPKPTSDV